MDLGFILVSSSFVKGPTDRLFFLRVPQADLGEKEGAYTMDVRDLDQQLLGFPQWLLHPVTACFVCFCLFVFVCSPVFPSILRSTR